MNDRSMRHFEGWLFLTTALFWSASGHAASPPAVLTVPIEPGLHSEAFDARELLVHVPARLPAVGHRSLVVVLHGGLSDARRLELEASERGLNMDPQADTHAFVVAYLNGTAAMPVIFPSRLAWNAGGGCCGLPAAREIDDVAYIQRTIEHLIAEYGIDRARVFGIGHSNGAMMTLRIMCELGIYSAAVAISGPLNLDVDRCRAGKGERILAIHGDADENIPIQGGRGTKGLSHATVKSEESSRSAFAAAGATYTLEVLGGVDHNLARIDAELLRTEGLSIAEKAARFFGLADDNEYRDELTRPYLDAH